MAYQPEIEKLERRYEDDASKWFAQLAEAYRKNGRLDDALHLLNLHLEDRPTYVSALIVLGRCHMDKNSLDDARGAFERVVGIDPQNIIALKALAEVAERSGDAGLAEQWLTQLVESDPSNDDAVAALARVRTEGVAAPVVEPPQAAEPEPLPAEEISLERSEETIELTPTEPSAPDMPSVLRKSIPVRLDQIDEPVREVEVEGAPVESSAEEDPMVVEPTAFEQVEVTHEQVERVEIASTGFEVADQVEPLVELESTEVTFDAVADETGAAEGLSAFDESLAWGTGERQSREVTAEDVARAEAEHEEGLVIPVPPDYVEEQNPEVTQPLEPLQVPDEDQGEEETRERDSLEGLPVIYPDDEQIEEEGDVTGGEPEPVVTETMAELYVEQGLVAEAIDVYRQLVSERPGDQRLEARLHELERGDKTKLQGTRHRFSAVVTGGVSVRGLLEQILSQRPGGSSGEGAVLDPTMPAPAPEGVSPNRDTPLDTAFTEDMSLDQAGKPTGPASDEVTLASVFGEEPAARPNKPTQPRTAPPASSATGFSFDEFFGGEPRESQPAVTERRSTTELDPEADAEFRSWLKGLKN